MVECLFTTKVIVGCGCGLWSFTKKLVEKCCHFYMVLLNIKKGEDEVLVASKHIWFLQYAKVWSFLMCCLENMAHLTSSSQVWLYCQNTWAFVTLLCRVYINKFHSCFGWEKTKIQILTRYDISFHNRKIYKHNEYIYHSKSALKARYILVYTSHFTLYLLQFKTET